MSAAAEKTLVTVALIGNPNTGKSTLFSALAGVHQQIGNYPGVTVEKKTGRMDFAGSNYELIDLPGLYSLAPRSRDEMVAVDLLLGRQSDARPVDAVICIADASNLERNLYLASQVLELGLPTVLAVNMLDVAQSRGIAVDLARLEKQLGIPVVGVQANRRMGIADLKVALAKALKKHSSLAKEKGLEVRAAASFPQAFEEAVARLQQNASEGDSPLPDFLARRLLLDTSGYLERKLSNEFPDEIGDWLAAQREKLAEAGCPIPGIETEVRYAWVREKIDGAIGMPPQFPQTASDRIDRVLTHRFGGLAVFAAVMFVVFQSVFVWAHPLMDAIESLTAAVGHFAASHLAEGMFRDMLVDGVIGGVGAVLQFLPQILVLFFFLAILEDCGYMARAAFLMDRIMSRVGLSGKSFIPMLSSIACTVPGIMAARVIENERDRLTTILVAPLLTCSARLPVYALLIAAFVPRRIYLGVFTLQGLVLAGLYVLGIVMAVTAALVFKRTITRGPILPFMLELPSYKWPSPRVVALRVGQRCWSFLRMAGTLILTVSIVVWVALYFPHDPRSVAQFEPMQQELRRQIDKPDTSGEARRVAEEQLVQVRHEMARAYQRDSILGRFGRFVEPAVKPLGWDWRIGCAVLASFPAREVVVATLGVMFNADEAEGDLQTGNSPLQQRLRSAAWPDGRPLFTLPTALSMLIFYALCAQCAATLAVIRRETNSWRWPIFTFSYMTVLAYLGALATYQLGTWLAS